jgi:hypothetical protein
MNLEVDGLKFGCFCYESNCMALTKANPYLELKTRPLFCPVTLSLTIFDNFAFIFNFVIHFKRNCFF